jgi:hypothetical protein
VSGEVHKTGTQPVSGEVHKTGTRPVSGEVHKTGARPVSGEVHKTGTRPVLLHHYIYNTKCIIPPYNNITMYSTSQKFGHTYSFKDLSLFFTERVFPVVKEKRTKMQHGGYSCSLIKELDMK